MNKKGRRFHTKEFKEEAVKLVKEQDYPVAEAARNLGVSPSILGRWKRELEKSGHLLRERIGMRYQFIDIEKQVYAIVLICEVMRVSCSGYYSWRSRKRTSREIEKEVFGLYA